MKQLVSIFLIAVFTLSQYAKQLVYMECKLVNSFKSSTEQCDCEKKYDIHSLNEKKPVGQQTHFHPVIDEYFAAPENSTTANSINQLIEKATLPSSPDLSEGNYSIPYRPPQA